MQQYTTTPQLAQLVRKARRAKGWDMHRAREHTGLALSTLNDVESVRRPGSQLRRATIEKLADGYGLDDDDLLAAAQPGSGTYTGPDYEHPATGTAQPPLEPSNGNGTSNGNGHGHADWLVPLMAAWQTLDTDDKATLAGLAQRLAAPH